MEHPSTAHRAAQLREMITVLRTRKWTLLLVCLITTSTALWYSSRQTPIYRASARLLVEPQAPVTGGPPVAANLNTESEIVRSLPVATRVVKDLELGADPEFLLRGLAVAPITSGFAISDVLDIGYSSPSAQLSADVVNSFAKNYIDYRRQQALKELTAAQKTIGDRLQDVQNQLEEVSRDLERAEQQGQTELMATLDVQRNSILARLGVLQQRLQDVQPDRQALLAGGKLIAPAITPRSPVAPNHRVNATVGLLLGLVLGIALAVLRDRLDDSFRGRADIEEALRVPVLATIPQIRTPRASRRNKKSRSHMLTLVNDVHGPASEAYRGLRTGIQFAASHQQIRTLLITSPSEGEGKTLTVANVAVAFAQSRRRVLLVSADLRRPTLERFFDVKGSKGLSGCLLEPEYPVESAIVRTDIENLELLPCGRVPHNPAELLTSPYLKELIRKAQVNRDFVLIDSAPLLPVSDSQTIAPHVDAVLLVLDASQTKRTAALEAARELRQIGAHLAGVVINRVESASPYYDRAGYYAAYKSDASHRQDGEGDAESALLTSSTGGDGPRSASDRY